MTDATTSQNIELSFWDWGDWELERLWMKAVVVTLSHYPNTGVDELRKLYEKSLPRQPT
jgi:hypothetical protein